MVFIYVLKLRYNKFYVGKTTNPDFRLNDHFNADGSEWTKKYKPINVHEIHADCDSKDETIITQEYMEKYGIDNVRGGPWCSLDISEHKKSIQQMIKSEKDICYKCGKQGHFANQCDFIKNKKKNCERCGRNGHNIENCYATTDKYGNYFETDSETNSEDEYDDENCFRCGRTGHFANNCYAKTDINGDFI